MLIRDHKIELDIANCLQDLDTWETFEGASVFKCVYDSSTGRARKKISKRISGASDEIKAKGSGVSSEYCVSW